MEGWSRLDVPGMGQQTAMRGAMPEPRLRWIAPEDQACVHGVRVNRPRHQAMRLCPLGAPEHEQHRVREAARRPASAAE